MISRKLTDNLKNSSLIRKMFEEGERLKGLHGPENVFDFSLGNPDLEPPAAVLDALKEAVNGNAPGLHRYMNNAGYGFARAAVAGKLSRLSGVMVPETNVVMTVGAAGALNVAFKTLLDAGDEVVILAPYFVDYLNYVDNFGGRSVVVSCNRDTFQPDVAAIAAALTSRTKAILLNSPNNPTGAVYTESVLRELSEVLLDAGKRFGTTIHVVSDEPYSEIVFDGAVVPTTFSIFPNSIVCSSWSKSLALPGERIGFIAVHPQNDDVELLLKGIVYCTRVLGFINAPALFQTVVAKAIDARVDIRSYSDRLDMLYRVITESGFTCRKPQGALYLFARSPVADDLDFADHAKAHRILVVPGIGFGAPGFFRLTFCVDMKTIIGSRAAWEALAAEYGLKKN
jgi:aspartate aminotransferase